MVFEWMHGKPHSKREALDVAASAVMMVCFVVLSLSAVWSMTLHGRWLYGSVGLSE
jgi:hypothetical protein